MKRLRQARIGSFGSNRNDDVYSLLPLPNNNLHGIAGTNLPPQDTKGFSAQSSSLDNNAFQAQTQYNPHPGLGAERGETELEGKSWRVGFMARLPFLSLFCLVLIVALTIAIIVVLLESDGKDVDTWGGKAITIRGSDHKWQVSVSALVALFNFVTGRTLAVMFTQAVAVSWWVEALRGKTLKDLHFQWEVGQSVWTMIRRGRLWGWVCLASIAFTAFAGLEALLQEASSSTTRLSTYPSNMSAVLAYALPDGFSGVTAAVGHDSFDVVYLTPAFVSVLQNYTVQSPIHLELNGCASTSNVSCATTLTGVGFQYSCNASRGELLEPIFTNSSGVFQPDNTVFQVAVEFDMWSISLGVLWQDKSGYDGPVVAYRNCSLVPALVEYPVNVTQGTVTLRSPTSTLHWNRNSDDNNPASLQVDKVLQVLPIPDYDNATGGNIESPGSHSTLGGIGLALSNLFDSSIHLTQDITNFGARVSLQGAFAAPYAQFPEGTTPGSFLNNTYNSPMDELLSDIRDIMFRSSIGIAEKNITNYVWNSSDAEVDHQGSTNPARNATYLGEYQIYHTVYRTDRRILGIAIGLMTLSVLAILPLFWGFWRLGRKVTMSPLEVAKAMDYAVIGHPPEYGNSIGAWGSQADSGNRGDRFARAASNHTADELVALLGKTRVRYGEVAPNHLGVGLSEYTGVPREGRKYY